MRKNLKILRKKAFYQNIFSLRFGVLYRMLIFEKEIGKIGYIKGGIMIPRKWEHYPGY